MRKITDIQQETLDFIIERLAEDKMPPTRMEIADYFGIHTNAAHERLNALADKGFIELIPAIARGIKLLCICPRKPCPFHQLEIATSA